MPGDSDSLIVIINRDEHISTVVRGSEIASRGRGPVDVTVATQPHAGLMDGAGVGGAGAALAGLLVLGATSSRCCEPIPDFCPIGAVLAVGGAVSSLVGFALGSQLRTVGVMVTPAP